MAIILPYKIFGINTLPPENVAVNCSVYENYRTAV